MSSHKVLPAGVVTRFKGSAQRRRPVVAKNWHLLPVFVFALLTASWFATNGDFDLFWRAPVTFLETVYDSMALNLTHGRFDVSPESIQGEAFVHNGRRYAYFPPAPALPRILLNAVFPQKFGTWARLLIVMLFALSMTAAVMVYREVMQVLGPEAVGVHRWSEAVLALLAGLGSTALLLTTRSYMHHEAPLWASYFAVLTVWAVLRFWRTASTGALAAGCVFAGVSFFSRATVGMGAILAVLATGVLIVLANTPSWQKRPRAVTELLKRAVSDKVVVARPGVIAVGAVAAIGGIFLFYNWARFGSPFEAVPLRYHIVYTKERLAHVNGTLTNLRAVPQNAYAYWLKPNLEFVSIFPGVRFDRMPVQETERVKYDLIEPETSILASSPALLFLAVLGCAAALGWAARRDFRFVILLASLLAGASSLLAMVAISERYKHDFYPFLICAAAIGLAWTRQIASHTWRTVAYCIIGVLAGYSVWAGFSLAFVYQRDIVWGVPDHRRTQLTEITRLVGQLSQTVSQLSDSLESPIQQVRAPCRSLQISTEGNRVRYSDCTTGTWQNVAKPVFAEFAIVLPDSARGHTEPLVVLGGPGAADILALRYEDRNAVRFVLDHWGSPAVASKAIYAESGATLRVAVTFDTLTSTLNVRAEGLDVLSHRVRFYDWGAAQPVFGVNRVGASMDPEFRGNLTLLY